MTRTMLATLGLALLLSTSACVLEIDDPSLHHTTVVPATSSLGDLYVTWDIDGLESSSLCAHFGVDRWLVQVSGPEVRETTISCSLYRWSTENDLTALATGAYNVRVTALDAAGYTRASRAATVSVLAGSPVQLDLVLLGSDFVY